MFSSSAARAHALHLKQPYLRQTRAVVALGQRGKWPVSEFTRGQAQKVVGTSARDSRIRSRTRQDGTVYQEGRKQADEWLPDNPAYLRIYLDIPGQHERVKHNEPLGKSATREEARRRADRWIMRNGVNDREKLEFALQPSEI